MTEKLVELTAWGAQAEFLEQNQEVLEKDCVLACKMVNVNKNDFGTRVATKDLTKLYFLHLNAGENQALVNNLINKYGGSKAKEMFADMGGGDSKGTDSCSIEIYQEEIDNGHPDLSTMITLGNGKEVIKGLKRFISGKITYVKKPDTFSGENPPWYPSCAYEKCYKKVPVDDESHGGPCPKCGKEWTKETVIWRWFGRIQLTDPSGSMYVSLFDDKYAQLVGMSANEGHKLWEEVHEQNEEIKKKHVRES